MNGRRKLFRGHLRAEVLDSGASEKIMIPTHLSLGACDFLADRCSFVKLVSCLFFNGRIVYIYERILF